MIHPLNLRQVAEYYDNFNTLERGEGAVLKESQKVRKAC